MNIKKLFLIFTVLLILVGCSKTNGHTVFISINRSVSNYWSLNIIIDSCQ